MKELKKEFKKIPEAINPDMREEEELTGISLRIMKIALPTFSGRLRDLIIKVAILLCDIEEEFNQTHKSKQEPI